MLSEGSRRRQALHIAAQLPQEREDALLVIELVRGLVEGYFAPRRPFVGDCEVVPLRPDGRSLRSMSTDKPDGSP